MRRDATPGRTHVGVTERFLRPRRLREAREEIYAS